MADYSSAEEVIRVFEEAIVAMTGNLMINFIYAEFLESHNLISQAKHVYEKLMKTQSCPLVLIQFQKFLARTDGVKAAREIFMRTRKDEYVTCHVYLAAAKMEYHVNKNKAASRKLYEIGFELFSKEPVFVLEYIDFLIHRN
eukprot:UN28224